jgi:hypothetical protein
MQVHGIQILKKIMMTGSNRKKGKEDILLMKKEIIIIMGIKDQTITMVAKEIKKSNFLI